MTRKSLATPLAETPAALGFRLPAEWEPHDATWIGWPHNATDWPGKFEPIPWVYGEIVRHLARGETVRVLATPTVARSARRVLKQAGVEVESAAWKRRVRKKPHAKPPSRKGPQGERAEVELLPWPTNRGWTRDFGPIFLRRWGSPAGSGELAVARFRFNGWAKYPDWPKDDAIPERAAEAFGLRLFPVQAGGRDLVLEGGSIDVNGYGTLLTTEECLLDQATQARNPGLSRQEIEQVLRDYLGVTNVVWLGKGIAGDDTHGHIDDFCRFVGPRTVVLCREDNPSDANYHPLEENRERLEGARLEDGARIEVVTLPMPAPLYFNGQPLPASYANFYISNAAVLVPTFNDPQDREALGRLGELITDRPVVGIHAVDLVWGLGTLHCLTQQQPAITK